MSSVAQYYQHQISESEKKIAKIAKYQNECKFRLMLDTQKDSESPIENFNFLPLDVKIIVYKRVIGAYLLSQQYHDILNLVSTIGFKMILKKQIFQMLLKDDDYQRFIIDNNFRLLKTVYLDAYESFTVKTKKWIVLREIKSLRGVQIIKRFAQDYEIKNRLLYIKNKAKRTEEWRYREVCIAIDRQNWIK